MLRPLRTRRNVTLLAALAVMLLAGIGASVYTYQYWRNKIANEFIGLAEIFPTATPAIKAVRGTAEAGIPAAPEPWNGKDRVNILLLGIDQRENDPEVFYRTDTLMVLTVDPVTLQAGMLSVPRDLWVPIPGYGANQRINFAHQWGDANDYPGGGGPQLARKTVESALGIRIHYYLRINFTVFESLIDRLGGITVDVPAAIHDTEYPTADYKTEVFDISAGRHTLDGATALKYARTRHDKNGDFGRARRQQQVIIAIKERVQDPRVFGSLLAGAPELIGQFSASIKTDMTLDQIQRLAALAQQLDRKSIKSAVLDQNYTEFATTPEGSQVLIARREKIAELRDGFFKTGATADAVPTTR